MGQHIKQAPLPLGEDLRHASHRVRQQRPIAHDPEPAGTLCDQHVPAWEKRHRPGVHQVLCHRHHAEVVVGRTHDRRLAGHTGREGPEGQARSDEPGDRQLR